MSFYIGKDNSGTPCFLLSRDTYLYNDIKATSKSISNSFAIDTRRSLFFCETYSSLSFYKTRTYRNQGLMYNVYRISINNLIDTKRFIMYINGYSTRISLVLPSESSLNVAGANSYYYGGSFIDIHTLYNVTSINIIVFYQTITGENVFNKYSGNSIYISSEKFIINGVDYFKEKFIVSPSINTVDPIFTFGNTEFQIVNGNDNNDTLSLTLGSTNNSLSVYSGERLVFSSLVNYLQSFLISSQNTSILYTIPSGLSEINTSIHTLPTSCKILAFTYYPRFNVYPSMKAHGIIINGNTEEECVFLDTFPVDDGSGNIISGLNNVGFYISNNNIFLHRIAEYSGDPIGTYPSIQIKFEYSIIAE